MKTIEELNQMTTREIAADARTIINAKGYDYAKVNLQNHILVANQKMKEFGKKINKEFGTHKMPPQIKVITDFLRFK